MKTNKKTWILCACAVMTGFILIMENGVSEAFAASDRSLLRQLEQQRARVEANETKKDTLLSQIKSVNIALTEAALSMDETTEKLRELGSQIHRNEESLTSLDDERDTIKRMLYAYIKASYEHKLPTDPVSALLYADSFTDYWNQSRYAKDMLQFFEEKLDEYKDMNALLRKRQEELNSMYQQAKLEEEQLAGTQAKFTAQIEKLSEKLQEAEKKEREAREQADNLSVRIEAMKAAERVELDTASEEYPGSWPETGISKEEGTVFESGKSGNGGTVLESGKSNDGTTPSETGITNGTGTDYYYVDPYEHTDAEWALLAGIIQAEAGSSHYPGMIAVGSVVMNRVSDSRFPGTIYGVVYSPHQFAPVSSGRLAVILAQGPKQSCMQAAQDVLDGKRNVGNLYFKAAWYAKKHGIVGVTIGGNVFH